MPISVRPAISADFLQMAELFNQIVAAGGTTAHQSSVSAEELFGWMEKHTDSNVWHVAQNRTGQILGFQFIEPHVDLPADAGDIATYVRVSATKTGIGSKLFETTRLAAQRLGLVWLNATIRSDNTGGLAYYQSQGFQTWHIDGNTALPDGTVVTKISKRLDV